MPIDGIFFTALVHELSSKLTNARVQNVYHPSPNDILLQLRQPGETHRLLISVHPQLARVHLTAGDPGNPVSPPPFCLLLRKHLVPGRIKSVEQPPFERIVTFRIEGFGQDGSRTERLLVAEIIGRYSNVILLDEAGGKILDAIKRIPAEVNSYREILPNRRYVPPPPQEKLDPRQTTFADFDRVLRHTAARDRVDKHLQRSLMGLSPFAAREILHRAGLDSRSVREDLDDDAIRKVWDALHSLIRRLDGGDVLPSVVSPEDPTGKDTFWCFPITSVSGKKRTFESVNDLLDRHFSEREENEARRRLRQRLESALSKHVKRLDKKIALQRESVQSSEKAEEYKLIGDLLTANLYRIKEMDPGTDTIALPNYWENGEMITVKLSPELSPSDNAQAYYRRYQKAKKTRAKAAKQLRSSEEEKEYLDSVQTTLSTADSLKELKEIEEELLRQGYVEAQRSKEKGKSRRPKQDAPSQPLEHTSSDGFRILVGRNNRQNDMLTLEIARPEDIWLHVKEIAGAHVVIETRGAEVPEETILEAANLAAIHSRGKHSSNVPVDYTLCRHVRKPKGARPGMVIYDHQRTLFVTPQRE